MATFKIKATIEIPDEYITETNEVNDFDDAGFFPSIPEYISHEFRWIFPIHKIISIEDTTGKNLLNIRTI